MDPETIEEPTSALSETEGRRSTAETEEAETTATAPDEEVSDITRATDEAGTDGTPPFTAEEDEAEAMALEAEAEAEEMEQEELEMTTVEEIEQEGEEPEEFQPFPTAVPYSVEEAGEDYDLPESAFYPEEYEFEEEEAEFEEPEEVPPPPAEPVPEIKEEPKTFICTEEETSRTLQMESYCCQQIKIPPMLPAVLKSFTKAAIRTQPRDLLAWAVAYFKALANDEIPPAKDRLEYPTLESPCGLTKGLLRVLHKQLGNNVQVMENQLRTKWMGLCLDDAELTKLLHLNSLDDVFDWTKFVVVAAASIVNDHLVEAMLVFCETMTQQPDGVDPYVPYDLFTEAYTYMADKMGVEMRLAVDVSHFLRDLSKSNFDLVGPKDFMAPECPPLF